ncbi:MAG: NADH-quinone oxidoreductase subunit A [Candidatus Hydrogenedentota bacterium]
MISPWWGILCLVIVALLVGAAAILIGKLFRPRHATDVKLEPYECGIDPVGDARDRIPVRYYTTAMLFLLFDAEAIFLWPWAVAFKSEGFFFLMEALVFIVVVGVGYAYAWRRGAFEWTTH